MSDAFVSMLGEELQGKDGRVRTADALKGKTVAFYFSAHWCGPCRMFTPMLINTYQMLQSKGKAFELVFVSSDRDQSAFNEYFGSMPWLALPFENRDAKAALSRKFKVAGIPTMVVLDESGKVINADGRSAVMGDPEGDSFPWRAKGVGEILESVGTFFNAKGEAVSYDSLKGKRLGLYFSAHWCGPCRMFTPELIKRYNKLQGGEHKDDFELIFVSGDRDPASFHEYAGTMPWLRFDPFAHSKAVKELNSACSVEGIPSLVLLSPAHTISNPDGRGALASDPACARYPWPRSFVHDLGDSADGINDHVAIVALVEDQGDDVAAVVRASLEAASAKSVSTWEESGEEPDHMFYYATSGGGVGDRVRALTSTTDGMPALLALDIGDNGAYYVGEPDFSEAAITKFMADVAAGKVPRRQMSS